MFLKLKSQILFSTFSIVVITAILLQSLSCSPATQVETSVKVDPAIAVKKRAQKLVSLQKPAHLLLDKFCSDCHDEDVSKGDLNMAELLSRHEFDGTLMFENIITGKMPMKKKKKQPTAAERQQILEWLSFKQQEQSPNTHRRLSRHEFVYSVNDLLGTNYDVRSEIPEDRGTNKYDSNHRISLTDSLLKTYFSVSDQMLEYAFPQSALPEKRWQIKAKLPIFSDYVKYNKKYKEGRLLGCMRANNGNTYSYFYEGFKAPEKGWYKISVDAAKVGNFKDHIGLTLYAGKYYWNDANNNPQRVLDVISLNAPNLQTYSFETFLNKGEELSINAYSKHTLKVNNPKVGAYVKGIQVKGPHKKPTTSVKFLSSGSAIELRKVIKDFAQRAFSKPLSEVELKPYLDLASDHLSDSKHFVEATKVGMRAILCSIRFLQVPINLTADKNTSSQKIAKLARGLWLSIPDAQLLSLAKENILSEKGLRSEIDRMLTDPKAERMIESLCNQWLNLKAFDRITPSMSLYPMYSDLVNHYLPIETTMFLKHIIEKNLPTNTLIDSDFSFLNQRLAQHYNIDGIRGQEMRLTKLPENSNRGGLLTMGSVLKVTADGHITSPILRGAWISKNIVGIPVSPPPENIKGVEPDLSKAVTLKAQLADHRSDKVCNSCHKDIDPYGFALESFGPTGQYRQNYRIDVNSHKSTFIWRKQGYFKQTMAVDSSSDIHKEAFADIKGLKKILTSKHKNIAYNFAKNFFEYFNGYKPNLQQRLEIFNMLPEQPEDCRLKDLLKDLIIYSLSGDEDGL